MRHPPGAAGQREDGRPLPDARRRPQRGHPLPLRPHRAGRRHRQLPPARRPPRVPRGHHAQAARGGVGLHDVLSGHAPGRRARRARDADPRPRRGRGQGADVRDRARAHELERGAVRVPRRPAVARPRSAGVVHGFRARGRHGAAADHRRHDRAAAHGRHRAARSAQAEDPRGAGRGGSAGAARLVERRQGDAGRRPGRSGVVPRGAKVPVTVRGALLGAGPRRDGPRAPALCERALRRRGAAALPAGGIQGPRPVRIAADVGRQRGALRQGVLFQERVPGPRDGAHGAAPVRGPRAPHRGRDPRSRRQGHARASLRRSWSR